MFFYLQASVLMKNVLMKVSVTLSTKDWNLLSGYGFQI